MSLRFFEVAEVLLKGTVSGYRTGAIIYRLLASRPQATCCTSSRRALFKTTNQHFSAIKQEIFIVRLGHFYSTFLTVTLGIFVLLNRTFLQHFSLSFPKQVVLCLCVIIPCQQ